MKCSRVSVVPSHKMYVVLSPVNHFLSFSVKQFVLALYTVIPKKLYYRS